MTGKASEPAARFQNKGLPQYWLTLPQQAPDASDRPHPAVPSWYDRRRHLGGSPHALHEAAGLCSAARWRGSRVAARGARAAARDAGVGFLNTCSRPEPFAHLIAAFSLGRNEAGFVEGTNLQDRIPLGRAGHYDRMPALAADLVRRQVNVLAAFSPPAALAAKAATASIPIVITSGDDPVKLNSIASLARPGGNITGVAVFTGRARRKAP